MAMRNSPTADQNTLHRITYIHGQNLVAHIPDYRPPHHAYHPRLSSSDNNDSDSHDNSNNDNNDENNYNDGDSNDDKIMIIYRWIPIKKGQ